MVKCEIYECGHFDCEIKGNCVKWTTDVVNCPLYKSITCSCSQLEDALGDTSLMDFRVSVRQIYDAIKKSHTNVLERFGPDKEETFCYFIEKIKEHLNVPDLQRIAHNRIMGFVYKDQSLRSIFKIKESKDDD